MNELKLKNLLGLAQRARLLVSGNYAVNEALKAEQVKLLILTKDTSDRTAAEYEKISARKKIPLCRALDKESLGQCLGKGARIVAAVLDTGFAESIKKLTSEKEQK